MRAAILLFTFMVAHAAFAGGSQIRTPVRIVEVNVASRLDAEALIEVLGATTKTQVVVLVRPLRAYGGGLMVASDSSGIPAPVETMTPLPSSPDANGLPNASRAHESRWSIKFHMPPQLGTEMEMYAVVCNIEGPVSGPNARDYRGLRYLPFQKAQGIGGALEILRDFGWTPTGYTAVHVGPSGSFKPMPQGESR